MKNFKSFNFFTDDIFNDLSKEMRRLYVTPTQHRVSYVANNGFNDWLDSIKDTELTLNETYSIVKTYMDYGNRDFKDLPGIFGSLSHQYNIELPAEPGIATTEYWENEEYYDNDSAVTP